MRREVGAVALETALVLPLTLLLIAGLMLAGFYVLVGSATEDAARDAARFASIPEQASLHSGYPSLVEVTDRVEDRLPSFVTAGSVDVQISQLPAGAMALPGQVVTVTVTLSDVPLFEALESMLGSVIPSDIERSATGRRE
ncbi:MAG TPA: TadE/TadG family type IV pilus assembly protein [Actinomycetota bacterium]|nr:TadE/TadG family type IV pilus assembly protein [Actinomycetota bacterium]